MNGKKKEFDEELLDTGFVVLRKEDIMSQAQRADLKTILCANDHATYLSLLLRWHEQVASQEPIRDDKTSGGGRENHPCCQ